VFPGNLAAPTAPPPNVDDVESQVDENESQDPAAATDDVQRVGAAQSFDREWTPPAETPIEQEQIVEGSVVQEIEVQPVLDAEEATAAAKTPRRRPRAAKSARPSTVGEGRSRKGGDASGAKPRRATAKPRGGRGRSRSDASQE
jgi:hypothetical protein